MTQKVEHVKGALFSFFVSLACLPEADESGDLGLGCLCTLAANCNHRNGETRHPG